MLLVIVGSGSVVALIMVARWYYWRNIDWQIKVATARLNRIIRTPKQDRQAVQQVLKAIHALISKSMAANNSRAVYQSLDLLKLAYGYGFVGPGESNNLMAICVVALHGKEPDTVSFALDAFKPLVRQLPPGEIINAVDQLALIGAMALKRKYNFLLARVIEYIFFIMEQPNGAVYKEILVASIRALKVVGVLGIRRRDVALFREMIMRLTGGVIHLGPHDVAVEIAKMLNAWLYRIVATNDVSLFVIITELTTSLVGDEALTEDGITFLITEWGDVAATACLNPNSPLAGLIIEFLFTLVGDEKWNNQWLKVVGVAGRVGRLAVYRHGLMAAFMVVHPLLDAGRKLLWTELKFVEYVDELHHQHLFSVIREGLAVLNYVAKQTILGSTAETIVELFVYWEDYPEMDINRKSIKKYCQLLLLFWLKNKRQPKRYIPRNMTLIQPLLFSDREKQRLGL